MTSTSSPVPCVRPSPSALTSATVVARSMSTTWRIPPVPPRVAPATMSGTPSPLKSPAEASSPNASPRASAGPLGVLLSTEIVRLTPPSRAISMRWTAP